MPHLHRFYHPEAPPENGEATLSEEESHHAMRVLRVRSGDAVELFNGAGYAWEGVIAEVSKRVVRVIVRSEQFTPRPAPPITLAQAWLHRDKLLDELVRHATVLGADRIQFYRAEHSEKKPRRSEKWERLTIEACKQCGRRWLPSMELFGSLDELLDAGPETLPVFASMDGPQQPVTSLPKDQPLTYIVGPEGDFSERELSHTRGGRAAAIGLGEYTLRSEAAAIAGLTLLQHHLGRLG